MAKATKQEGGGCGVVNCLITGLDLTVRGGYRVDVGRHSGRDVLGKFLGVIKERREVNIDFAAIDI